MIRAKTLMSALAATALVAACSSDDDKASTPTPTPPVAQAPKNILFFLETAWASRRSPPPASTRSARMAT